MKSMKPKFEKTRRVSIACTTCRQKRIRVCPALNRSHSPSLKLDQCDGREPSCGPCYSSGTTCEYLHGENKRRPPSKHYVEILQTRIRVLEAQLVRLGQDVHDSSTKDEPLNYDKLGSEIEAGEMDQIVSQGEVQSALIHELTDRCGSLTLDDHGHLRFFGPQSNFNLLRQVPRPRVSLPDPGIAMIDSRFDPSTGISWELQEHLLSLYYCWQNPWVYLIRKEVFMKDYLSGNRSRYCTPLLLFSIFSVAARFSDNKAVRSNLDDPQTAGNAFAVKAKALMQQECEITTIPAVQSAVLLSIRCMGENKEPAGWLYIGMATRMAFNLGLNLNCREWVNSGLITEEEAEVREAAWSGCWTLDKLFCLGLGRIGMTPEVNITCRKPELSGADEFEPWESPSNSQQEQLASHSKIISTANYMSDHLTMAVRTLDKIYAPTSQFSELDNEALVSKTDLAINTFWATLPSYLRLPSTSSVPALPHVYQLHIQFHTAEILLHRPLINRKRSTPVSLRQALYENNSHLDICRNSAREIVTLLRTYKFHYSLRYITVGTVCHTFTAAVIHLMDAVSDDPSVCQQGNIRLRACISALQEMGTCWAWSFRACRAIQALAQSWTSLASRSPASRPTALLRQQPDATRVSLSAHGVPLPHHNDRDISTCRNLTATDAIHLAHENTLQSSHIEPITDGLPDHVANNLHWLLGDEQLADMFMPTGDAISSCMLQESEDLEMWFMRFPGRDEIFE